MCDPPESPPVCEGSRSGQSMVEYALIVSFMVLTVIAVMTFLSPDLRDFLLDRVSNETTGEAQHAVSEAIYE